MKNKQDVSSEMDWQLIDGWKNIEQNKEPQRLWLGLRYREKDRKKGEVDGTVSSGDLLTSNCDTIIPIHSEQRYKFKLNVKETVIRELKSQIHNKKI
jgi:hypothetical protein